MKRQKNPCVYTGKVGARMRPRSSKPKVRASLKEHHLCKGGPLHDKAITVERSTGGSTLPIVLHGQTGRYVNGTWLTPADDARIAASREVVQTDGHDRTVQQASHQRAAVA
jgi:hypothetical protein